MITENREEIYSYVKESLKWDHKYTECLNREYFLESILRNIKNMDIYYINSWKARNSIKILKDVAVIIWDMTFWRYFENFLAQVYLCKIGNKNLTQEIICFMTSFLSDKYQDINKLSSFLAQINNQFGTGVQHQQEHDDQQERIIFLSKIFALYHEIGHLEQRKNNSEIKMYHDMLMDMFGVINNNALTYLKDWEKLAKNATSDIIEEKGKGKAILEEIVSDVYAIIHTIRLYKKLLKIDHLQAINECMQSYEYISGFQHMFTTINSAWENHNIEIKFGVPLRCHEFNNYVNQLEITRNEIGGHVILLILRNIYNLNKIDLLQIVNDMDMCYINNTSVINCLANEHFICTAIDEAFHF